jgi:plastocyanin domain-containing protein
MMIINLMGLLVIALIVWWFWLYKPAEADVAEKEVNLLPKDSSVGDEDKNV